MNINPIFDHTNYNKGLKQIAREPRNIMTPYEKIIWFQYLRMKTPQVRRQRSIGPYIVDFFVPKLKLVIEIDGDYHLSSEQVKKDEERDSYLNDLGIEIIRIRNDEIENSFEEVKSKLDGYFNKHSPDFIQI